MTEIVLQGGNIRQAPTLLQALRIWLRIGLLSFGGPAAQIALMHREIVDRHLCRLANAWCRRRFDRRIVVRAAGGNRNLRARAGVCIVW